MAVCEVPDTIRIGLDVDGVLAGFEKAFTERAHEMGVPWFDHYSEWDRRIGYEEESVIGRAFTQVWESIDRDFWRAEIEPIEKNHVSFPVAGYFTARSQVPDGLTKMWLLEHGYPEAPVFRVNRGTEKEKHLIEQEIDVFVDDKPSTIRSLQESKAYDGVAALMTTPANVEKEIEPRIMYLARLPNLIRNELS